MRVRRAGAWLLVRVAALILVPVLLALVVFAFVMAILTEGPFLLAAPDWAACWHRCRRVAHVGWAGWEGPRHTGRYGFGGRWGVPGPGAMQYHTGTCPPHFLVSSDQWARLRRMLSEHIIQPPAWAGSAAALGGGYDGLALFVGACPCVDHPPLPPSYPNLQVDLVSGDVLTYRVAQRMRPPKPDVYSFLEGGS